MKFILLLAILLLPFATSAQTTIVVPAGGNVQAAWNAAKCGDTITLAAGANFDFSTPLQITAKTPCTNTERDYITITTSDPSGIPAVLSNYPRDLTRPTTAMAARMPKLRTTSSEPVVNIARGAKWVRFEGVEFTAVDNGVQVIRLVQSDLNGEVRAPSEMPDHISFRRCWFHPPQETGVPMNSTNIARSVENAMYLDMNNGELLNNAFTGFAGKNKYGGEAGRNITSTNWLITLGENNVARNNFFGAWTYAIFSGGSGIPRWAVTGFGTVSNCQGNPATQCDFSNVNGLTVGTPISIFITTSTSQNKWGAAFIKSISGQTVVFEKPLCQSFDGSNSCTGQNGTPANGDRAQWDGLQPKNYLFERNAFVHDPEWRTLLGECGGKGYDEIKSGINFTFNGNLYEGCSGHTVTVRNQNGDFPWASVSGLRRTNNYYRNSNNIMVGYCQDVIPTRRSSGLLWNNNLAVGVELNPQIRTGTLSGNWTNCDSPTVTNNTIVWSAPGNNFNNFGVMNSPVIKDNIMHMGQNACWRPDTSVPMINCWPNGDIGNNGLINTGIRDYEQEWWLASWPNQTVLRTWDGIFVRNTFDATGDYHLAVNSPLKGKGSNGSDPGANVDVVMAAVFGNEPLPSPSPVPTVQPTPQPSPSVSPTPAASPAPTATPTPPSGQITLSGQTFFSIGGGLFPFTTVVLSDSNGKELQRIQEQEDAKYSFTVAPGSYQVSVVQDGYNMSPSKIHLTNVDATTGGLSILNFTIGPVGAFQPGAPMCVPSASTCPPSGQPSPSPSATPVSSPSPVPTPTIIPNPSPSPSVPQPSPSPSVPVPSPSPTPVPPQPSPSPVAIEVWDEPWPSNKTQQDAIWKRLHESGWKCTPNVPATSPTGNRIRCWRIRQ